MLYIILSILLYSVNNVLWKRNIETISIPYLIAYRSFFTSLIAISLFLNFHPFESLEWDVLKKVTLASMFGVIGLFSMLKVLKKASLQWLGIYNLIGVIVMSVYLFVYEQIDIQSSLLGGLVILFGFTLFLYANREEGIQISIKQHFYFALMTICFSISGLIHWKNLNNEISPLLIISNQEVVVFLVSFCVALVQYKQQQITLQLKLHFRKVLLMATILFSAVLFGFLGLKVTNPMLSSLLFLASPLTTIFFGMLFFKEQIRVKNIFSILIIASGAFVLRFYQN
jgi:hypothetical protein